MGRNKVIISETKLIIYGFDGPCNGYFANYYDLEDEDYKETGSPKHEIGFFPGVSKGKILNFFERYDAVELAKEQTPEAFHNLCMDLPC